MEINDCTPSFSQACRFKKISYEQGLTLEVIAEIMSEEKTNQRDMFKVPMERIRKYISKANVKALMPEIRAFYDSDEGKACFEKWLAKHPE